MSEKLAKFFRGVRTAVRATGTLLTMAFKADKARALGVFLVMPLGFATFFLIPAWLGLVADGAIAGNMARALFGAMGIAASLMFAYVVGISGWTMSMTLDEKTSQLFDEQLVQITAGLPTLEHHERPEYADKLALLAGAGSTLSQATGALAMNAGNLIGLVGSVVLLARVDKILLILPLMAIPSMIALGGGEMIADKARRLTAERGRLSHHLFTLSTQAGWAKELRIFGLRDEMVRRKVGVDVQVNSEITRASITATLLATLGWLFFAATYAFALLVVVRKAIRGEVSPGEVLMAMALASQVNGQVTQAAFMTVWVVQSLKVVARFVWLTDYAARVASPIVDPIPMPSRIGDGIALDHMSFKYPGTETNVLIDLNLQLPAGKTVALVGENGAGKTSLIKLLCRFYDPTEGSILLDGTDIRRFEVSDWREHMSAAFQDFARLELTARENIAAGNLSDLHDDEKILGALNRAGAEAVMDALPSGLDTQVGRMFDDGVELSIGQWQRLALGRAMMRDEPLLLVLDEPTASLDAQTEHSLFERWADAAKQIAVRTGGIAVLVSHRFSTVRMADIIVVMASGRIVEAGSHAELMSNNGLYAELYGMQARAYR